MRTLDDLFAGPGVAGRRVLVRSDLNVPLDGTRITDDGRIRASLPTLRELVARGARVVVCAHLGRPQGSPDPGLSLAPVAARLGELLGSPVRFATDTVGDEARAAVTSLADGGVVVVENLRFSAAETSKDDATRMAFATSLATLAEFFVSDGFGALHRRHASVYDVAGLLPSVAGRLVVAELEVLRRLTTAPARPYAVVLGGSKVSDKLGVIANLLGVVDRLMIGGGMVFTILAAQGHPVGSSLLEADQLDAVREFLDTARQRGVDVVLPVDIVAATAFAADAPHQVVAANAIPADRIGLDIGPASGALFAERLADCDTVFWNGPMGVFEFPEFAVGTRSVAQALATRTEQGALTVIGGGDSAAAVRALGFADDAFSHISTGGGASLEYLEGSNLPGLAAMESVPPSGSETQ
jgi:phosphoglycerate kinase